MVNKKFVLVANITTEDPMAVERILTQLVGVNAILRTDEGFRVRTTMEGTSAREMNRKFLSALRRNVDKTTLKSEWTHENTTERFIDDVVEEIR